MKTGEIFNIYDILGSSVGANDSITLKLGQIKSPNDNYQQKAQVFFITGVASLPAAATSTTDCAQSVSISRSDQDIVFATRDTRFQSFVSDIQPGDVYMYATGTGATAGIKIKAATNKILVTTSDMEVSNGGTVDFVAMASKVDSILNNIKLTLQGGITTPSGAGTFTIPYNDSTNSVAGSVLKADK